MKRVLSVLLALAVAFTMFGCSRRQTDNSEAVKPPVPLRIVTTYGGDDGNRKTFEAAVADFEQLTGIPILDNSDISNENWKAKVMADFETGSEPDVLFFFTDADAEPLIRAQKVVPISEIQQAFPEYAGNMNPDLLPTASDGSCYAVPMTGYWEQLYVNRAVLAQCGVALPEGAYTWEQFLRDCAVIRDAGITPIACSLAEVSHYWFEFAVMNNGNAATHGEIPVLDADGHLLDNTAAQKWIAGLEDIRGLYEANFFPGNTLTAADAETVAMFCEDQAAFLLDGSWKMGFITENYADRLDHFAVCAVPAKGARDSSEAIGGISTGFFITRKAWDNPEKRDAAVSFISYLTSDEVLRTFVTTEITALKNPVTPSMPDSLHQSAARVLQSAKWVGAVQDLISGQARSSLFSNIQNVVSGKITAREAVETAISLNQP